jgi:hypothetical protein
MRAWRNSMESDPEPSAMSRMSCMPLAVEASAGRVQRGEKSKTTFPILPVKGNGDFAW